MPSTHIPDTGIIVTLRTQTVCVVPRRGKHLNIFDIIDFLRSIFFRLRQFFSNAQFCIYYFLKYNLVLYHATLEHFNDLQHLKFLHAYIDCHCYLSD